MPIFFCTVGFGLEKFAEQELSSLPTDVCIQKVLIGKCFFSLTRDLHTLFSLKTVERLFICLAHVAIEAEFHLTDEWIRSNLNQELCQFEDKLVLWKQLSSVFIENIKFRVNCRLSGKFRKAHLFRHFAALIGNLLSSEPSFIVDLEKPDLDVFVHLSDTFFTIGLPLKKKPLSERSYLRHIAVRSTICCAMCMAVEVSHEDVILDPMCGAATLLVEAVKQFNCNFCLGVDIDKKQIKLAEENLRASQTDCKISLISGDSSKQFLRKRSVDVVLCDVPFGRKFGKHIDVKELLSKLIGTVDKVVKTDGRVCILISQQLKQTLLDLCCKWTLLNQYPVRLGTLEAVILAWKPLQLLHDG